MKKNLLFIAIIALFLNAALPIAKYRLTIVNRSEFPIGVRMVRTIADKRLKDENPNPTPTIQYYFTIPRGTGEEPSSKTFIVDEGKYNVATYYVETWDPVYGFKCNSPQKYSFTLSTHARLTVLECARRPAKPGDRPFYKLWNFPKRSQFRKFIPPSPTPVPLP